MGSMTHKSRRAQGKDNTSKLQQVNAPGMCVSVDQLESRNSGYISVMRGFMTKQRYTCDTVFVNHYSGITLTYLQKSLSVADTIKAKKAFDAFTRRHGTRKSHCHSDNGIFSNRVFLQEINKVNQTIGFCGTYTHIQYV